MADDKRVVASDAGDAMAEFLIFYLREAFGLAVQIDGLRFSPWCMDGIIGGWPTTRCVYRCGG